MKRLLFELRYLLGDAPWDTGVSPPELLAFLAQHPPGRALDLGCGTGTNARTLVEHGWQVTAIDFSARALRAARRRLAHAGRSVELVRGDVAEMAAASGQYQLILDIGCYHGLEPERRARYADNLRRRVGPGSSFLLYAFLSDPSPLPTRWPTRAEIEAAFTGFLVLREFSSGYDRQRPSAWFNFEMEPA